MSAGTSNGGPGIDRGSAGASDAVADTVEVLSLTVAERQFPARPSALPDVRDFLRMQLATTPVPDDQIRVLRQRVAERLLDMAGTGVTIQVSVRLVRNCVEIDVVRVSSHSRTGAVFRVPVAERKTARCGVAVDNEPGGGPRRLYGQDPSSHRLPGCCTQVAGTGDVQRSDVPGRSAVHHQHGRTEIRTGSPP